MSGALLEAVNLGVRFDGIAALDEVNFEVYPGETVGLVGESGVRCCA
jgi:ABC-type oligopeptide transport system ATPase subunit